MSPERAISLQSTACARWCHWCYHFGRTLSYTAPQQVPTGYCEAPHLDRAWITRWGQEVESTPPACGEFRPAEPLACRGYLVEEDNEWMAMYGRQVLELIRSTTDDPLQAIRHLLAMVNGSPLSTPPRTCRSCRHGRISKGSWMVCARTEEGDAQSIPFTDLQREIRTWQWNHDHDDRIRMDGIYYYDCPGWEAQEEP